MLCLSRLCSKNFGKTIPRCVLITNTRSNHNLLKSLKDSRNSIIKLKSIVSYCGKIFPLLSRTPKSITIALRHSSSSAIKRSNKTVGSWLLICSGMVFVAVALGGVTRLTESGLSMVTWRLLGEKMPVTETQWIEEFDRYKQYPEFQITNKNMSLNEFKRIWWMEYIHRMWGRLIGAVFIFPASYFWFQGVLSKQMKLRVLILGSLIGLQGLMGWYMVKSGLENKFDGPNDIPRVSQYRLAAHLGLALTIYAGFLYNALDQLIPAKLMSIDGLAPEKLKLSDKLSVKFVKLKRLVYTTKGLIFFTAISGAFVAGLDAGLIYNSFPTMAGKWIPDDLLALPFLRNFTENPTTVQFDHRILGITTLSMITILGFMSKNLKLPGRASKAVLAVICAGYLQVILGITTLLLHVPIPLAASHQSGSLLLLSSIVWLCHELKYVQKMPK